MSVGPLPAGSLGFDTADVLSKEEVELYVRDYNEKFVVRYVGRGDKSSYVDLTKAEAEAILAGGLALGIVQHPLAEGWKPTGEMGDQFGTAAANFASDIGVPPGVTIWCDLEGIESNYPASEIIAYCNAWYAAVEAAGFLPGLYVGANCGLTGDQLYYSLKMKAYWQSGSHVPEISERGYQMVQNIGDESDSDVVQVDNLGGAPIWWLPN